MLKNLFKVIHKVIEPGLEITYFCLFLFLFSLQTNICSLKVLACLCAKQACDHGYIFYESRRFIK